MMNGSAVDTEEEQAMIATYILITFVFKILHLLKIYESYEMVILLMEKAAIRAIPLISIILMFLVLFSM